MNPIKSILLAAALVTGNSFAQSSTTTSSTDRDAHRAKVEATMEADDYNAWKAEHDAWGGHGRNADKVTPENSAHSSDSSKAWGRASGTNDPA